MEHLIGASLKPFGITRIREFDNDPLIRSMPIIEVNRRANPIRMRFNSIERIKPLLKNHIFSMHSASPFVFSGSHIFNKISRDVLLGEIEMCPMLGIKRMIFHIMEDPLTEETIEFLKKAKSIADEKGVLLTLENNWWGPLTTAEEVLRVVDGTGVKVNVDVGHLKVSSKNLEEALDFVDQVKNHTIHSHVHSDWGEEDQHIAFTEDDEFIVSLVKEIDRKVKNKIWWIVENDKLEDTVITYETLKKVLG